MDAEDVDAALRRAPDEPAHEIALERPGADEEPAAQRHRERRLAAAADRPDPLPGALDAVAHAPVEAPAAGDLEAAEPGAIQHARQLEEPCRTDVPGERLLREKPNGRVPELGHGPRLSGLYGRHEGGLPPRLSRTGPSAAGRHRPGRGSVGSPREASDARDVAPFPSVDPDAVADVHEERHLDDGARLERRRLRDVGHRVALDAGLGVDDRELDRGR